MIKNKKIDFNFFLKTVRFKKQYLKKLTQEVLLLKSDNSKIKSLSFTKSNKNYLNNFLVMYIISITFSKTNTLFQITDFSGKLILFYSAGSFKYSGKSKKLRLVIFKKFYRLIFSKLKFIKNKPISLHLINVGKNKFWIVKKLKKKLFLRVIRNFNSYPFNGCRKKKVKRKKIKKKEEMAEWFKAADCKSVGFPIVGSNPSLFRYVRSIT